MSKLCVRVYTQRGISRSTTSCWSTWLASRRLTSSAPSCPSGSVGNCPSQPKTTRRHSGGTGNRSSRYSTTGAATSTTSQRQTPTTSNFLCPPTSSTPSGSVCQLFLIGSAKYRKLSTKNSRKLTQKYQKPKLLLFSVRVGIRVRGER